MQLRYVVLLAVTVGSLGCSSDDTSSGTTGTDGQGSDILVTSDVVDSDGMATDTTSESDASTDGTDGDPADVEMSDTTGVDGNSDGGTNDATTGVDVQPPKDTNSPTLQCISSADSEAIANADLFAVIISCVSQCVGQMNCAADCVQTQTGLSAGCAACTGVATECAAASCGIQCVGGASAECFTCVQGACGGNFSGCSGIALPGIPPCTPDCDGKDCGADGCGSVCGVCTGTVCEEGVCAELPENACDNGADEGTIASANPQEAALNCGLECIAHPDITGCATQCIVDATGLTVGCSYCFGEQKGCSATNCLFDCFDATTPGCKACEAANCNAAFTACSGVPFPGGLAPGACDNPADATAVAETDTKSLFAGCIANCESTDEQAACSATCTADVGFTTECGNCMGDAVTCMLTSCTEACSADATSPECAACAAENCNTAFQACAGLNLTDLYPCEPVCTDKVCGLDGCGGSCGTCEGTTLCVEGACEPLENAWCVNTDDQTAIGANDMAQAGQDCSLTCLGNAEFAGCTGECTADATGVSSPCGLCFGLEVACAFDLCLNQCSADSASAECIGCLETNCSAGFEACSGLLFSDFYSI